MGDTDVLQIDVDLVKPTMRAAVEQQLNLIAHGKADFNAVLEHTIDTFTAKFKYFVEHIQAMDELFEVSFSPLASSGRPISRYRFTVCFVFSVIRLCYRDMSLIFQDCEQTKRFCRQSLSCDLLVLHIGFKNCDSRINKWILSFMLLLLLSQGIVYYRAENGTKMRTG